MTGDSSSSSESSTAMASESKGFDVRDRGLEGPLSISSPSSESANNQARLSSSLLGSRSSLRCMLLSEYPRSESQNDSGASAAAASGSRAESDSAGGGGRCWE